MRSSIKSRVGLLRAVFATIFGMVAGTIQSQAQETTYAQKLGFKSEDIILIMQMEDMGMSLASNKGVIDSLERGIGNSVTVMMPCSWVPHVARYMDEHQNMDVGLQLTLNSEFEYYRWSSVAGIGAVPSLLDGEGCFWKSVPLLLTNAQPDQVDLELRAQIQRAEKMKMPYSHLDSHLGALFRRKDFLEKYLKIATEKQVPIVVAGGHLTNAKLEDPAMADTMKDLAPRLWTAGLPVIDDLVDKTDEWEPAQKKQKLLALLYRIKPGITQMNFRPAGPSDEMRLFTRTDRSRSVDAVTMAELEAKRVIDNRGIIFTTWRELMARRKKSQSGPL